MKIPNARSLLSIIKFETIGVLVIVAGSVAASVRFLLNFRKEPDGASYRIYRRQLGRSIIIGLEFLIAGDIIRTVIVADTLKNVSILGLIILIRTFPGLTLHLEVEGHWPRKQVKADETALP